MVYDTLCIVYFTSSQLYRTSGGIMSYQERRALIELISTVVSTVFYTAFMAQRYPAVGPYSPEVFHFWGSFFLILIPVGIVVRIIIYILFAIFNTITTNEAEPT